MLNQYTISGIATFNSYEKGGFFTFESTESEKDNFTFGSFSEGEETLNSTTVTGTGRITFEGEELYDFKFVHKIGEFEVSHSFRNEFLGNCIDFKITHPEDTLNAMTHKFFGNHKDFAGQIVVCRSVEDATRLYFEFCSMVA